MLQRIAVAVLVLCLFAAASPAPKTVAPPEVPHPVAMFLSTLSSSGKQRISFKAAASGHRFFFEEAAGVTVYIYDDKGNGYRKETFLRSASLASAMKRYAGKP